MNLSSLVSVGEHDDLDNYDDETLATIERFDSTAERPTEEELLISIDHLTNLDANPLQTVFDFEIERPY